MSVATLERNLRLKKMIKKSGQTQKAFAARIGMSEIVLSWHILGRWNLTLHERTCIAAALNKPAATLFN